MKTFLPWIVLLAVTGYANVAMAVEDGSTAEKKSEERSFIPNPKLPNVLILGDSISIG